MSVNLTRAQRRYVEVMHQTGKLPRRAQGRTLVALRRAGLVTNHPKSGSYILTPEGHALAARQAQTRVAFRQGEGTARSVWTGQCPFCEASNHVEAVSVNSRPALEALSTCVHLLAAEEHTGVYGVFVRNAPSRAWKGAFV